MSIANKIAQNTAIQAVGKIAGMVLSLVAAGFVLRYLGEDGFGKYTGIVAFLQIFGIMMDFGLYIVLVKKIAVMDAETPTLVNHIFTLRILSGILFLGIAPLIAWVIGWYNDFYSPEIIAGVALTTLFFFFISMNQLVSAIFQKFFRTDWIAIAEFSGKILLLLSTILFIWLKLPLLWIMFTLVLSSGVNFIVNFLASRKYMRLRLAFNWASYKRLFTEAWPTALSIAFALMYFKGDTVLLTFFETESVVGWYGAPYKILEVLVTFPAMFAGLALPLITTAWKEGDHVRFQRMMQKSFDALAAFAIPMVAGTILLAPHIIQVIAGDDYEPSVPVLKILVVATAAIFFGTLFGYVIVAIDKQKTMLWGYAFVAVTSLVGYILIIPIYSIIGAALVTVYSETAIFLITLLLVLRTSRTRLNVTGLVKMGAASICMYVALAWLVPYLVEWLNTYGFSATWRSIALLLIALPLGTAVYSAAFLLLCGSKQLDVLELIRLRKKHA